MALVEKEKENEVGYLQNVLRNSVSEVDRLMSVNAEITTVSIVVSCDIIKVGCTYMDEKIILKKTYKACSNSVGFSNLMKRVDDGLYLALFFYCL